MVIATALPSLANAQAYQRIAPHEPPVTEPPATTPPTAPTQPPASTTVILPTLRGLVFLPTMSALQTEGVPVASAGPSGVGVAGLALLNDPAFIAQIAPFIARALTFADLQQITSLTTAWYRARGRPFVAVTVPPQNIGSGVVQVVVTEYRVGTLTVAGNQWFSSEMLRQESGLVPGQTLTLPQVQDDLDWLNANPFRSVNTVFQPGTEPGTTDVTLQTEDRLPVRAYAGYDNQGVPSLGHGEWNLGAVWGNVFGTDQTLSYQFTRSLSGRYDAHALNWTVPLPWRDKLLIFGSYAKETPDIGNTFAEAGNSGQASIRYAHALPRLTISTTVEMTETIQIGYDFKTTNNNLEFGGAQVFASQAEIDQVPLIYNATLTDPIGQTAFENQLVLSPGGLTGANTTQAFQAIVAGSAADYIYDRIGLTRVTFLPWGVSWTARMIGQLANRNLLYSEQLGAGGMDSVRGYYTDAALGSQGVLVSQEVRGPAFSFAELLHIPTPVSDQEQVGVFWDYGHVSQVQGIPSAVNAADLSSVGLDLHATLNRYVDVKFDIGWQLRDVPGTTRRGAFGDVAVVVGF
jgi:hemolysin activation/secretion protein